MTGWSTKLLHILLLAFISLIVPQGVLPFLASDLRWKRGFLHFLFCLLWPMTVVHVLCLMDFFTHDLLCIMINFFCACNIFCTQSASPSFVFFEIYDFTTKWMKCQAGRGLLRTHIKRQAIVMVAMVISALSSFLHFWCTVFFLLQKCKTTFFFYCIDLLCLPLLFCLLFLCCKGAKQSTIFCFACSCCASRALTVGLDQRSWS